MGRGHPTLRFIPTASCRVFSLEFYKADHGYAENLVSELKASLLLSPDSARGHPVVLTTQAINNVGIEELYQELENQQRAVKVARQSR